MTAVDLVSPLPRAECVRRLRAGVGSYWAIASGAKVIGSVADPAITLRKRIYYRNSFQPTLHGRLSDAPGGGTRIHAEFHETNLMPVFIAVGVLIVVIAGLVVGLLASRGVHLADIPLPALIAPLLSIPFFVGLAVAIPRIGRAFARDEPKFLIDFLGKTLEAAPSAQ